MTTRPAFRRLALARGDSLSLDDARGTTVRVGRGQLWITQYGDPTDHVLEAGDSWAVERNGRTIVQAQRDALVDLTGPEALSPLHVVARTRAFLRFAAWLRRAARARDARRWAPYV